MEKLPIYRIDIDALDFETGIDAVSLVEMPAIQVDFLKFSKAEPIKLSYDESQHIISGPVILNGVPIYRYNETYGEHYIIFDEEAIDKMIVKYSKYGLNNSVNIEHNNFVDGVYMIEMYKKDVNKGINPTAFNEIPDKSLFASYKVTNLDVWDKIQKGEVKGFSLQGMFNYDKLIGNADRDVQLSKAKAPTLSFDEYVDKLMKLGQSHCSIIDDFSNK